MNPVEPENPVSPVGPIDHQMLAETGWNAVRYATIERTFTDIVAAIEDPALPPVSLHLADLAYLLDVTLRLAAFATASAVALGAVHRNAQCVLQRFGGGPQDVARLLGISEQPSG